MDKRHTRIIDAMGRIVLPDFILESSHLKIGDDVTIYMKDNALIIKPFTGNCVICDNSDIVHVDEGLNICTNCFKTNKIKTDILPKRYLKTKIKKEKRVSIPSKIRKALSLNPLDTVSVTIAEGNTIIVKKIETEYVLIKGKNVKILKPSIENKINLNKDPDVDLNVESQY